MTNIISKLLSKLPIKQIIKFAIVGAMGTLVNLSILYCLTEIFNMYYIVSEIIAFIAAGIHNYILDKIWTFKENIEEKMVFKYFQFLIISSISLIVNLCILFILVEFFGIWYIFAEIIAIMGAFLINFSGNKIWTFRKQAED